MKSVLIWVTSAARAAGSPTVSPLTVVVVVGGVVVVLDVVVVVDGLVVVVDDVGAACWLVVVSGLFEHALKARTITMNEPQTVRLPDMT